jgi:hypothetical protein
VKERLATKQELETCWSIEDVIDGNEVLDAWADAERKARKKAAKVKS